MRVSYFNSKFESSFPAEDLRFRDRADADFSKVHSCQSEWTLKKGEDQIDMYLESSFEDAREAFLESMEEFSVADEEARAATVMEAMLYRRMTIWDQRNTDAETAAKKKEFLGSLNIFLGFKEAAGITQKMIDNTKNIVVPNMSDGMDEEVAVEVVYEYTPDQTDADLRGLVEAHSETDLPISRSTVQFIDSDLQHEYNRKNEPSYDTWRRVMVPEPAAKAKLAAYRL